MNTLLEQKPASSVKLGDIFVLGEHRLLCGDATNPELIRNFVGGEKIDLCLTDPPYSVAYVEGKSFLHQKSIHKEILNDHRQTESGYLEFTRNWLAAMKGSLAAKNTIYVFNSDKMLFALKEAMQKEGWHFAQLLIWVKTQSVIGRLDYLPQHELIAYGWHGRHKFQKSKDKSILVCPKPSKNRLHPTMKPVGLLRRLILNSSGIRDVVYDPFGGSGSTLIACEQTKRRCFMVELDPEYCRTIIQRWEKLTGLFATAL